MIYGTKIFVEESPGWKIRFVILMVFILTFSYSVAYKIVDAIDRI